MEYKIMGGHFSIEKHQESIDIITQQEDVNNQMRETEFRKIAQSILPAEGFEDYESPEKSQSVPFDFIATKDNKLALIEMKGAGKNFNYSSATQYSRLLQVYEALEKDNIKPSLFLLQINLKYGVYQILTKQYYDLIFKEVKEMMKRDPELGRKQKIDSSLDVITEYRNKYKV